MKLKDNQKRLIWDSIRMDDYFPEDMLNKEWEVKLIDEDSYFPYVVIVDNIRIDYITKNLFNKMKKLSKSLDNYN